VMVMLGSRWADEAIQRFLRESRAAASVSHPAVARTLGVDVSEEGLIFQVQEFVDGASLAECVGAGSWMSPGEAARMGATLSSALAQAHAAGIVHRDLKPSNVMLTAREPGLKLLDFGIARLAGDVSGPQLTSTGQVIGTPDFMAPEQFTMPDHVDGKSDVYALGIVMYWSITGRLPHRSPHLAARAVLDPVPMGEVVAGAPAELVGLVMGCLSREPADRPASAALAVELEQVANQLTAEPLEVLAAVRLASARVVRKVGDVKGSGPRPGHTPADETHTMARTPRQSGERG